MTTTSRIRGTALALLLAATTALTGCSTTPADSASPPTTSSPPSSAAAPPAATGTRARLEVDGTSRDYLLHRPAKSGDGRKPLVIAFHGRRQTAEEVRRLSGLDKAADRRGLLVAYPEGLNKGWGDGGAPTAKRPDPDTDVRFTAALIKKLVGSGQADPRRVYVVGFSNGGSMALRMAAQRPGLVAAAGTVAGQLPTKPAEVRPTDAVPALLIYGDKDPVRPITGMPKPGPPAPGAEPSTPTLSARASAEAFAAASAAAAAGKKGPSAPLTEKKTGYTRTIWDSPSPRGDVELIVVHGGGHTWPGSAVSGNPAFGPTSKALDATAAILAFVTGKRS
ncbi:PHB depolymerase family esterase [Streptomyces sp. ISL-100]|uniref:alpha/beta hydrolase family esterase n=1 Tax=Streptomyces sp. ISL-100 TaxID=2819173 RepID=UPI001BEC6FB0|nr:PHB depolymerase family esterase [Streptomyces sp. ISL-100]MBT2400056.1 dienelactone hydrolase family protein [Streptomyces sp. ISL-100]